MGNTRWMHAFKESALTRSDTIVRAIADDVHRDAITLVVEKLLTALERDAVGGFCEQSRTEVVFSSFRRN